MDKPEALELEKAKLDIFKTIAECNNNIVKKLEGINNSNGVYVGTNSCLNITGDFNMGTMPLTTSSGAPNNVTTHVDFTPNSYPQTIVLPKTKPVKTKKRKK